MSAAPDPAAVRAVLTRARERLSGTECREASSKYCWCVMFALVDVLDETASSDELEGLSSAVCLALQPKPMRTFQHGENVALLDRALAATEGEEG